MSSIKSLFSLHSLLFSLALFLLSACQKNLQQVSKDGENASQHLDKPYVILISIDGYRYDYKERFQPPHLTKFAKEGVQATSMLPCFPSKTFPNHYSIATGMRPENHGLVNNSFYDPEKDGIYKISDREKVEDGSWYKGTPIWVQAAKAGMVTASYFFVGSEANIQDIRPTYYYRYDGAVPNRERTRQVVEWLELPAEKRPHLVTMYFSDIDTKGHSVGPNDDGALQPAILEIDAVLGDFFDKLKQLNLPINVFIVSDHGMEEVPVQNYLPIELLEDEDLYRTVNGSPIIHFYLKDKNKLDSIYQVLKTKENHFKIYKTTDSPYYQNNPNNPRNGDLLAVADHYYFFADARKIAFLKASGSTTSGQHGYPTDNKDIHTIFYAKGPNLETGKIIPAFENIHIYPLLCELLGLDIPTEVDGDLDVLQPILKQ